jgi:hypothetical protein
MKKTLILGILGFAAAAASSYAQGTIALNNFSSSIAPHALQDVVYGVGSGGTVGQGVNNTFTAGFYWVSGSQAGAFNSDATGIADPASLFTGTGSFIAATGSGSTGGFANAIDTGGAKGEYAPPLAFNPGLGQGASVTIMIVAYNGTSYLNANTTARGHSQAFVMTTSSGTAAPQLSGSVESDGGFAVHPVPEPSVFALSGLGAAALMIFRRKK